MADITSRLLGGVSIALSLSSILIAKKSYEKEIKLDYEQKDINEIKRKQESNEKTMLDFIQIVNQLNTIIKESDISGEIAKKNNEQIKHLERENHKLKEKLNDLESEVIETRLLVKKLKKAFIDANNDSGDSQNISRSGVQQQKQSNRNIKQNVRSEPQYEESDTDFTEIIPPPSKPKNTSKQSNNSNSSQAKEKISVPPPAPVPISNPQLRNNKAVFNQFDSFLLNTSNRINKKQTAKVELIDTDDNDENELNGQNLDELTESLASRILED